jgi:hypothetical protein
MEKAAQDALNAITRDTIEHCISSLMALGATNDTALMLMLIQSYIRMNDATMARAIEFIADNPVIDDNDDEDAGWQRAMRARH